MLEPLAQAIAEKSIEVRVSTSEEEATATFWDWKPDIILLDLSSQKLAGWRLMIRFKEFSSAPIIALVDPEQGTKGKILALRMGADDSVYCSDSVKEVAARVKAHLRRTGEPELNPSAPDYYYDGQLLINFSTRQVFLDGRPIQLTSKEFAVLACLARHPQQVMSLRQIARLVWADPVNQEREGPVRYYIYRLRRKLEPDPSSPIRILNAKGFGYYLDNPRKPL